MTNGQGLEKKGSSAEVSAPTREFYDLYKGPKVLHNTYNDLKYLEQIQAMKIELQKLRKTCKDLDENEPTVVEILTKAFQ
jgi:hypothetical protein